MPPAYLVTENPMNRPLGSEELRLHVVHAGAGRSVSHRQLEVEHGFRVPLGDHFDTAVRQVADQAAHPLTVRRILNDSRRKPTRCTRPLSR